ncbi:MAG: Hsp20/alpha crystallin family protein [Thermoproteaceae archaeon]|jgi:HSP20 family protein|nr:Hsp20/alpha crystallin family protein [Thermoproteaceae archaeon]
MPSFFEEFDRFLRRWQKFFEEFERQIEEDVRRMMSVAAEPESRRRRYYYYGFEITIGPDGRPVVREFGNIRRRPDVERIEVVDEIDPLADVVEEDDKVKVVLDMPGVDKDEIKIYVSEDGRTLTVDARGKDRKYHKEVRLPAAVDPQKAKATYRNGVLTVELEKVEKKRRGFEIKIE